jgi:hypothetical protein
MSAIAIFANLHDRTPHTMGCMTRACLCIPLLCTAVLVVPACGEHLLSPGTGKKSCPERRLTSVRAARIQQDAEPGRFLHRQEILDYRREEAGCLRQRICGPTHLGQYAGLAADAWLSTGSHAAAACVYSLLTAAAKADAWDDKMPTINSVYMQNRLLSGTALAYLKVRNSGAGTAQADEQIQQ